MPTSGTGSHDVIYERDLRNLRVSRKSDTETRVFNKLQLIPRYESRLSSCLVPYQHGGSSVRSCSRSRPLSHCDNFLGPLEQAITMNHESCAT